MPVYQNYSNFPKTFHGVIFGPHEIAEVPGYIHSKCMVRITDPSLINAFKAANKVPEVKGKVKAADSNVSKKSNSSAPSSKADSKPSNEKKKEPIADSNPVDSNSAEQSQSTHTSIKEETTNG